MGAGIRARGVGEAVMKVLKQLRGRSIDELATRSRQALAKRAERVALAAGIAARGLTAPGQRIAPQCIAVRPALDVLRSGAHAAGTVIASIATQEPSTAAAIRRAAQEIRAGQFRLLGLGGVSLGDPPDWHRDPLTGVTAPRRHWSTIAYLDPAVVGDHKVLWEFNRHQYLIICAQSWLLDGNADDFDLIQRHLMSWITENRPRVGVNWASSLEVSYRAISWCWLLWLLADAPWTDAVRRTVIDSLEAHALHIERYLSTYFSPNTHLTGEALGMFYIGTVVPESRHAKRWRFRGAEILESCIGWHVLPDGVYFEQALHYHRYTAEIYLHFARLAESTDLPLAARVKTALASMFDVLRSVVDGDGILPAVGDDDGGMLLPLGCGEPAQLRGLLLAGATYLNRPDWLLPGPARRSTSYWLCGLNATDKLISGGCNVPGWTDVHFSCGGIAVIRDDWTPEAGVALIDCGPHGALNWGHAHADALSIVVHAGTKSILVDRGTFTYVGPDRDAYRATASHNTLEFDGVSSVRPTGPFQWSGIPRRASATLVRGGAFVVFDGLASGHVDSQNPSEHRRVVVHVRNGAWIVYDKGLRDCCSRAVTRWHFAAGSLATVRSPSTVDIQDPAGQRIASCSFPLSPCVETTASNVSPQFGAAFPAVALIVDTDVDLSSAAVLLTGERGYAETLPNSLLAGGHRGCAWVDATGSYVLVTPPHGRTDINAFGLRSSGSLFVFRAGNVDQRGDKFEPDSVVIIVPDRLERADATDGFRRFEPSILMTREAQNGWRPRTMHEVLTNRD